MRNYADLEARMAVMEGKLARLAIGAPTPPSDLPEPLKRQRPYPDKEATGRTPGGQPGHAVRTVARLEPVETERYEPVGLCGCEAGPEAGREVSAVTRQVISVEVTTTAVDHVVINRRCTCGAGPAALDVGLVPAPRVLLVHEQDHLRADVAGRA